MYGKFVKLGSPSAQPSASGTSMFRLPRGQSYRALIVRTQDAGGVRTEAEIKADADAVKLHVEGRPKWDVTPTMLIDLRSYYGDVLGIDQEDTTGMLVLELSPFHLLNPDFCRALQLGTKDLNQDPVLEINWSAACAATIVDGWAIVGPDEPSGLIRCVRKHALSFATTGDETDDTLDLSQHDVALLASHYTLGAGTVTYVKTRINGEEVEDAVPLAVHNDLLKLAQREPVSGYVHIDHLLRNLIADRLVIGGQESDPEAQNARIRSFANALTWSVLPGAHYVIRETIEPARAAY